MNNSFKKEIEVLKETLENVESHVNGAGYYDLSIDNSLKHAIKTSITVLLKSKQQQNEWIPVSEKLPNDSKELVLTITQKNVYWLARYDNDTWIDGAWTSDTGDIIEGEYNDIVTHWMPLPEPVQGGKP